MDGKRTSLNFKTIKPCSCQPIILMQYFNLMVAVTFLREVGMVLDGWKENLLEFQKY